ncbi:hypothetical protein [Methylorubrum sp. SB2]|uniref:DUF7446 family protein n=1 Tax=Methylorubrum subtropicum TaxID=3138812 RepID=UPI00313DF490
MAAKRPLHVGCSPLTKRIYAGSKSADGKLWLSDQTDVTTEALLAVVEAIGPGYKQALIATNGGPSFEIEVRQIPAPESATEAKP